MGICPRRPACPEGTPRSQGHRERTPLASCPSLGRSVVRGSSFPVGLRSTPPESGVRVGVRPSDSGAVGTSVWRTGLLQDGSGKPAGQPKGRCLWSALALRGEDAEKCRVTGAETSLHGGILLPRLVVSPDGEGARPLRPGPWRPLAWPVLQPWAWLLALPSEGSSVLVEGLSQDGE